jgi:hypothetical protein
MSLPEAVLKARQSPVKSTKQQLSCIHEKVHIGPNHCMCIWPGADRLISSKLSYTFQNNNYNMLHKADDDGVDM